MMAKMIIKIILIKIEIKIIQHDYSFVLGTKYFYWPFNFHFVLHIC